MQPCWIETKTAELIDAIKRSPYAKDCFADARQFAEEDGYVMDVALAIAWRYWGS